MPSWLWVIIVAGILVLAVLLVWAAMKGREKQADRQRRKAEELRIEAERKLAGAQQAEESAQRAAERSEEERAEAERLRRESEARQARAGQLEEIAEGESQRAREQRTAAERTARQAQSVDPESPDPDDDFDVHEALGSGADAEEDRRPESSRAD
jgi:hypothetical protein